MSTLDEIRKLRRISAAEGYLDLIMVFADRWPPSEAVRDRLAQRALDELAEVPPRPRSRGHVLYLQGQALRAMRRYEEAVGPLQQAAEHAPEDIHIHLALGWCFKRVGRLDLAIQALEEALEVAPGESIIHYNLACYWSLAQNSQLAVEYLSQSFDLDPNYRDLVADEPDFDPIRNDREFQTLTSVIV